MKLHYIKQLILGMCILGTLTVSARAADKKELQARFEQRYPQLLEYKTQGKVGETTQGLIEAVEARFRDDPKVAKFIDEENGDRQALYKLIADEERTTPQKVAERTAQRNFEKARPGEYLKGADGKWKRKA